MCGIRLDKANRLPFVIPRRTLFCAVLAIAVSGCTKNIPIEDAYVVEALPDNDPETNRNSRFQVNLVLPREALAKISSNELYIHIRLIGCNTGEIRARTEAFLDGKRMNRFEDLQDKLQQSSQQFYIITGLISDRIDWQSTCVTLTGGSYILGKVRSDRVRLRWPENIEKKLRNGT